MNTSTDQLVTASILTGSLVITSKRAERWLAMLCAQLSRRIESPSKFKPVGIERESEHLVLSISWRAIAVRLYFEPSPSSDRFDFIRATGVENRAFAYGKLASYEDRAGAKMQVFNGADLIEAVLDYFLSWVNVVPGPERKRLKPSPDKYFEGNGITIAYPAKFASFKDYYENLKREAEEMRLKRPNLNKRYETDIALAEQALGLRQVALLASALRQAIYGASRLEVLKTLRIARSRSSDIRVGVRVDSLATKHLPHHKSKTLSEKEFLATVDALFDAALTNRLDYNAQQEIYSKLAPLV